MSSLDAVARGLAVGARAAAAAVDASAKAGDVTGQLSAERVAIKRAAYASAGGTPHGMLGTRCVFGGYAIDKVYDPSGATASDGVSVAKLDDARISYNATATGFFSAVQATATNRPEFVQNANGGMPAVRFTGGVSPVGTTLTTSTSANLDPGTSEFRVFLLMNQPQRSGEIFVSKGNYARGIAGWSIIGIAASATTDSQIVIRAYDGTTNVSQSIANPGGPVLVEAAFSGTALQGFLNGSATGWANGYTGQTGDGNAYAAAISSALPMDIGATRTTVTYGRFDFYALVVVKGAMTADEVAAVRRYLTTLAPPIDVPAIKNYRSETIVAASSANAFGAASDAYIVRIPALLVTRKGTAIAAYEARNNSGAAAGGDSGHIGTVVKRSTDNGVTWGTAITVKDDGVNTWGNPALIENKITGRLHCLLTYNDGRDTQAAIVAGTGNDTRRAFACFSDDDGLTWSALVEQPALKPSGSRWFATGPGAFEQLQSGRLLIPCSYWNNAAELRCLGAICDDDRNWTIGFNHNTGANTDETASMQFSNGEVYVNSRGLNSRLRYVTRVAADGTTITTDTVSDGGPGQIASGTEASVLHWGTVVGRDVGLLCTPSDTTGTSRANGTIWATTNNGKTWPARSVFRAGSFAYSSIAKMADGTLGILFEADGASTASTVRFAKADVAYPGPSQ